MEINNANLKALFVAFNAAFKEGLGQAASQYGQIATTVPSTTAAEEYGWLGQLPGLREWLGDRVVHGIGNHGYTIKNKSYELTVSVPLLGDLRFDQNDVDKLYRYMQEA